MPDGCWPLVSLFTWAVPVLPCLHMQAALKRDLELWIILRERICSLIQQKSESELLHVPAGLSNNMLWIFGHVIRSADVLILKPAGHPMNFPDELHPLFQKGSSPAIWTESKGLKDRVLSAEAPCRRGILEFLETVDAAAVHPEPYATSMGFTLHNAPDSLRYNLSHESLHLGQLQIYARLV